MARSSSMTSMDGVVALRPQLHVALVDPDEPLERHLVPEPSRRRPGRSAPPASCGPPRCRRRGARSDPCCRPGPSGGSPAAAGTGARSRPARARRCGRRRRSGFPAATSASGRTSGHRLIEYPDPPGRSPEQLDPGPSPGAASGVPSPRTRRPVPACGRSPPGSGVLRARGCAARDGLQDLFLPFRQFPHRVSPRPLALASTSTSCPYAPEPVPTTYESVRPDAAGVHTTTLHLWVDYSKHVKYIGRAGPACSLGFCALPANPSPAAGSRRAWTAEGECAGGRVSRPPTRTTTKAPGLLRPAAGADGGPGVPVPPPGRKCSASGARSVKVLAGRGPPSLPGRSLRWRPVAPIPSPCRTPEPGSTPDLAELLDHVAVDLAREYVDLVGPPLPRRRLSPDSSPKED